MEKTQHIVILAAGDFPTHEEPLRALREADFVVCCDSAYGEWKVESGKRKEEKPFVVIGDGDSLSESDKVSLGARWLQVDEQDYNDLHKAMAYATSQFTVHNSQFTILGATGRREDHTLGNISYLVTFAEEHPGADIEMLTDYGRLRAMTGSRTYASFPYQQVSIVSMTPDLPFSAEGLKWPLDGFRARRWWQATLNEALGTEFSLRTEGWLVVFQTYNPKIPSASV
ncbi:MAG: thiamine diphosphokinase [Bacteroidales bacterium]|nr:thiamine diphosphokinase [Bacteroidales bacterium]